MRIPPHTLHRSICLEMIFLILAKEINIKRPTQNNSTSVTNNYPGEGDTSLSKQRGIAQVKAFRLIAQALLGRRYTYYHHVSRSRRHCQGRHLSRMMTLLPVKTWSLLIRHQPPWELSNLASIYSSCA